MNCQLNVTCAAANVHIRFKHSREKRVSAGCCVRVAIIRESWRRLHIKEIRVEKGPKGKSGFLNKPLDKTGEVSPNKWN